MKKRLAVVTAGLLAGLMALGTANALVLDTAPGTETTASEQATAGVETTYEVGDAGTVTLGNDGAQLDIVSVQQNDGWQIEIEVATGREVEVDFRSGTRRIQFNAELEDGQIRVRARERVVTVTSTTQATTQATTQSATQPTTPTTAAAVAASAATGTVTYEAGAAGTVTISNDGSQLSIIGVDAADGWSHEIEVQVGREVEMDFRKGGDRVQFNAELEDGEVRIRVRTRTADDTRTEVTNGVDSADDDDASSDDSVDDRSDDSDDSDDNSGRGSSDDRSDDRDSEDNSGQGSSDHDDDSSSDD